MNYLAKLSTMRKGFPNDDYNGYFNDACSSSYKPEYLDFT